MLTGSLQHLRLNWKQIKAMPTYGERNLDHLLVKYGEVFAGEGFADVLEPLSHTLLSCM